MSLNDPLSNLMSNINNAEQIGRDEVTIKPSSRIILRVLKILHEYHYVGEFKEMKTNKGNLVKVNLINQINKCGAIKPRFAVKRDGFEKFEKRLLMAKDFGIIVVSTSDGIMTHTKAKEKGLGGRLLAYCY